MATTTNYGWETPDDTDLVKDGAAAIRTLGSSIDTTTKALNPETTLGDISYRSSTSNTNTRLAIGTTGQILTVSGGVPAWATPAASGGMTQLATGTLSGTTVALTNISQSYRHLQIVVRNFDPTTDGNLNLQINQDNTSNRYFDELALFSDSRSFNKAAIECPAMDSSVTQNSHVINLYDYTNTTTWKTGDRWSVGNNGTTTTIAIFQKGFFGYNQTSAITSLLFENGSGFQGGTYFLYGVS